MNTVVASDSTERITVDLPKEDYTRLKLVAAAGGRGFTMTSIVRSLIHEFLDSDEDAVDLALISERKKNKTAMLSHAEVEQVLAAHQ